MTPLNDFQLLGIGLAIVGVGWLWSLNRWNAKRRKALTREEREKEDREAREDAGLW